MASEEASILQSQSERRVSSEAARGVMDYGESEPRATASQGCGPEAKAPRLQARCNILRHLHLSSLKPRFYNMLKTEKVRTARPRAVC